MAGFNPNRKKKTYSLNRSQPAKIVATIVDGKVEYFDETLVSVDSPYYVLNQPVSQGVPPPPPPPPPAEYDEDVIEFDWTDSETVSFNTIVGHTSSGFSQVPYLTLEVLPAEGFENIAFFANNLSATGFIAHVSAPFSGQIVYRAIVSSVFPVIIERVVVSSSFYYTASAGKIPESSNSEFVATYNQLWPATYPSNIFFTPIDDNNNGDAGVAVVNTGSIGLTSTEVSYSAPVYNSIHYFAVKS
jgi:hypothetical protein